MPNDDLTRAEYLRALLAKKNTNMAQGGNVVNPAINGLAQLDTSFNGVLPQAEPQSTNLKLEQNKNGFDQFMDNVLGFVDEMAAKFGAGFVNGWEGILDFGATAIGALGDATGWYDSKPLTDWAKQDIGNAAAEWSKTAFGLGSWYNRFRNWDWNAEEWEDIGKSFLDFNKAAFFAKNDLGDMRSEMSDKYYGANDEVLGQMNVGNFKAGEFLGGIAHSVGFMLPSIMTAGAASGAGAVAQKAASLTTLGLGAAGQGSQEALNEGASSGKALGYGAATGAVEVASEMVVGPILQKLHLGVNKVGGVVGKQATGSVLSKTAKKEIVKEISKAAFEEGAEEVFSALFEPITKSIYQGSDAFKDSKGNFVYFSPEYLIGTDGHFNESVLGQFASGAITGGIMSGGAETSLKKKVGNDGYLFLKAYSNALENANGAIKLQGKGKTKAYQDAINEAAKNIPELNELKDKVLKNATQAQKNELGKLLNNPERFRDAIYLDVQEQSTKHIDNLIKQATSEAGKADLSAARNTFNQIQRTTGTNVELRFKKGETTYNPKTNVLYLDPKTLQTEGGKAIVHEYLGHAFARAVSPDVQNKIYNKIVATNYGRAIEDNIKKVKEYDNLEEGSNEFKEEVIAHYLGDTFEQENRGRNFAQQLNNLNQIIGKKTMFDHLVDAFTGVKKFKYGDPIFKEYADVLNKFLQANSKNARARKIRAIAEKIAKEEKLTEDEKKFYKKYKDVIDAVATVRSEELRHSAEAKEVDSEGKELSKQQIEFFKDSKVRDENGNLVPVYHYSNSFDYFNIFDENYNDKKDGENQHGFYFSNSEEVAKTYQARRTVSNYTDSRKVEQLAKKHNINLRFDKNIGEYNLKEVISDWLYKGKQDIVERRIKNFLEELYGERIKSFRAIGDTLDGEKYVDTYDDLEDVDFICLEVRSEGLVDTFIVSPSIIGPKESIVEKAVGFKTYLNIKNPLIVDAKGSEWNNIARDEDLVERGTKILENSDKAMKRFQDWYYEKDSQGFTVVDEKKAKMSQTELLKKYLSFFDDLNYKFTKKEDMITLDFGTMRTSKFLDDFRSGNPRRHDNYVDNFYDWILSEVSKSHLKKQTTRQIVDKAFKDGYDGVIIKNVVDSGPHHVKGGEKPSNIYVAFESNQIKNVENRNPTDNEDIRYKKDLVVGDWTVGDNKKVVKVRKNSKGVYEVTFDGHVLKEATIGGETIADVSPSGSLVYRNEGGKTIPLDTEKNILDYLNDIKAERVEYEKSNKPKEKKVKKEPITLKGNIDSQLKAADSHKLKEVDINKPIYIAEKGKVYTLSVKQIQTAAYNVEYTNKKTGKIGVYENVSYDDVRKCKRDKSIKVDKITKVREDRYQTRYKGHTEERSKENLENYLSSFTSKSNNRADVASQKIYDTTYYTSNKGKIEEWKIQSVGNGRFNVLHREIGEAEYTEEKMTYGALYKKIYGAEKWSTDVDKVKNVKKSAENEQKKQKNGRKSTENQNKSKDMSFEDYMKTRELASALAEYETENGKLTEEEKKAFYQIAELWFNNGGETIATLNAFFELLDYNAMDMDDLYNEFKNDFKKGTKKSVVVNKIFERFEALYSQNPEAIEGMDQKNLLNSLHIHNKTEEVIFTDETIETDKKKNKKPTAETESGEEVKVDVVKEAKTNKKTKQEVLEGEVEVLSSENIDVQDNEIVDEAPKRSAQDIKNEAELNNVKVYTKTEVEKTVRNITKEILKIYKLFDTNARIKYNSDSLDKVSQKIFELLNKKNISPSEVSSELEKIFSDVRIESYNNKTLVTEDMATLVGEDLMKNVDVQSIVKANIEELVKGGKEAKVHALNRIFKEVRKALKSQISTLRKAGDRLAVLIRKRDSLRRKVGKFAEITNTEVGKSGFKLLLQPFEHLHRKGIKFNSYDFVGYLDQVLEVYNQENWEKNFPELPYFDEIRERLINLRENASSGVLAGYDLMQECIETMNLIENAIAKAETRYVEHVLPASMETINSMNNSKYGQARNILSRYLNKYKRGFAPAYVVLESILGGNSSAVRILVYEMQNGVNSKALYVGEYHDLINAKLKELGIKKTFDSKKLSFRGHELTIDQAMGLYISTLVEANYDAIDKSGVKFYDEKYNKTVELAKAGEAAQLKAEIEASLPEEYKKLAKWLLDTMNDSVKSEYMEWYENRFGEFNMRNELGAIKENSYWTLNRAYQKATNLSKAVSNPDAVFTRSLNRTGDYDNAVLITGALSTFDSYIDKLGRELYVKPVYEDALQILNAKLKGGQSVSEVINSRTDGDKDFQYLKQTMENMLVNKSKSTVLDKMVSAFSVAKLSLNVGSMLKQFASIWTSNLPFSKSAKGLLAKLFGDSKVKAEYKAIVEEIGGLKYREAGKNVLKANADSVGKLTEKIAHYGMIGISKVDLFTMSTGVYSLMVIAQDQFGLNIGEYVKNTESDFDRYTYYKLENGKYTKLTEQPADWDKNYGKYYTNPNAEFVKEHWAEFELSQIGNTALSKNAVSNSDSLTRFIFGFLQGANRAAIGSQFHKYGLWARNRNANEQQLNNDLKQAQKDLQNAKAEYEANEDDENARIKYIEANAKVLELDNALKDYQSFKLAGGKAIPTNMAVGILAQGIFVALINALMKRIKGKKDWDEMDAAEEGLALAMAIGVNWVPLLSQLSSIVQGYEVTVPATEIFNQMSAIFKNGTSGNYKTMIRQIAILFGDMTGIPVQTVYSYIYGALKAFDPAIAYEMRSVLYGASLQSATSTMKEYADRGNQDKTSSIVGLIMKNYKTGSTTDETNKELARLYISGYNALPKTAMTQYTDDNGDVVKLTADQIKQFTELYSQSSKDVSNLLKLTEYRTSTDEEKAKAIKKIYDTYYAIAKAKVTGKNPEGKLAQILSLTNGNVSLAKYIVSLNKISQITETTKKTRKELVLEYINRLRGYTKAEKSMLMYLSGYSVSGTSKNSLVNFVVSYGSSRQSILSVL